ncbi:MAG TPA: hypothetical protein PLL75_01520 [Candidatus Omnitrophota bacterium]|nr:hypothetical protein [Candidatus Omnitrophota bacterium]HPS36393.1 hypothetical protein [Candidatus Omnitrophota bacterium]
MTRRQAAGFAVVLGLVLLGVGAFWAGNFYLKAMAGANQAVDCFLKRDAAELYAMNHPSTKEKITPEELEKFIAQAYPDLGKAESFETFLISKFFSGGYFCLTFEFKIKFEKSLAAARVSMASSGGKMYVLAFSFFPHIE